MSTDPQNTKVQGLVSREEATLVGLLWTGKLDALTCGEIQDVTQKTLEKYAALEAQNARLRELVKEMYYAMRRYEMDVDTEAPHTHRYMMTRADEVIHPDNFPTEKKGE